MKTKNTSQVGSHGYRFGDAVLDTEIVMWPAKGQPRFQNDVTALSPEQGKLIAEVAEVMRCKPTDALCAMALAWLDQAHDDAPELNVLYLNEAINRYVQKGQVPAFDVAEQLTTNSATISA